MKSKISVTFHPSGSANIQRSGEPVSIPIGCFAPTNSEKPMSRLVGGKMTVNGEAA